MAPRRTAGDNSRLSERRERVNKYAGARPAPLPRQELQELVTSLQAERAELCAEGANLSEISCKSYPRSMAAAASTSNTAGAGSRRVVARGGRSMVRTSVVVGARAAASGKHSSTARIFRLS